MKELLDVPAAQPPLSNGYENVKQVKRVDKLEIQALPAGQFSKLFIELAESGIGQPIQVPVVVARGKRSGPMFGITAALHGNELNGIAVIHQLLQRIDLNTLKGTVVCVVAANMPGLLAERREFSDGQDLNHIMPGSPNGKLSEVYAFNLVDRVTGNFDYLVDLHTASAGRVNSLYVRADLHQQMTAQMAYLLHPQIIVHNPPSDHTLRGVAAELGKPAITVEVCDPQKFQRDPIKRTLQGIKRILGYIGMTPKLLPKQRQATAQHEPPVLCKKSYWIKAERGGMLRVLPAVVDSVRKGELIATQVNIFGDLVKEYLAPEDGIVVGHCVNPLGQTGARILHLGVLMDQQDRDRLSEFIDCSQEPKPRAMPQGQPCES